MKSLLFRILAVLIAVLAAASETAAGGAIRPGAARTEVYAAELRGKRVALLSNHTGVVDGRHTLDVLMDAGVDVCVLLSPEHGFRGTADAGEHVSGSRDDRTGLPIVSLYGKNRRPSAELMDSIDVVISDLQDVGLRFYTYYITMLDVMNSAAAAGKQFMVLDRPNPNGMYVDGPLLDMSLASGVGRLPIPVVHGLTLGELARMIVGEHWLDDGRELDLRVVECENYTHADRYELPVAPSPNLRSMQAIYLYPSTCLFEGTVMSLGRGTDTPFCVYGHPAYTGGDYSFTPRSMAGAKNPPLLGKRCSGRNLNNLDPDSILTRGLDLSYVIDAYRNSGMRRQQSRFFTTFFDKLIGNTAVRRMIEQGASAEEIKASWRADVEQFEKLRLKYLIYPLNDL